MRSTTLLASLLLAWLPATAAMSLHAQAEPAGQGVSEARGFTFQTGDRVAIVGGALAQRLQYDGWLEARLQARLPQLGVTFRNLGFAADELGVRQRTAGFGSQDEHLARCKATVLFVFHGQVEAFSGEAGLAAFEQDLEAYVEHLRSQRYDGAAPPRVVLFTPTPFEELRAPPRPPPAIHARSMALYAAAVARVAERKHVPLVDLHGPLAAQLAGHEDLTVNGLHLRPAGNALLAQVVESVLLGGPSAKEAAPLEELRGLVLDKDRLHFDRYHATDGYNVYGGRSSLEYDGITNFTVLQRELEVLDAMAANLDRRIQALARGAPPPQDLPLPEQIPVPTNRPGSGPGGAHTFLSGKEALARMTPGKGLKIGLFADEALFPELANPVQMAWDTRGRLWVACWPTYPHWQPGTPRNDKLIVLEDEDGDGQADRCGVFADDLHNPTGFELWNGGVLLAAAPDLLFLKDTDGDGKADLREHLLSGISSADTHHTANSFTLGPDGALYFGEGVFHHTQIESAHGPVRNHDACTWRFDPRTFRVERFAPFPFLNPHGIAFERWGQAFLTDGTTNQNFFALPLSGHVEHPRKHPETEPFFPQRSRPAAATEVLSSPAFPEDFQQNLLIANVIGFQGIFRYRLEEQGSGFGASELEPIVHSSDPNFRPVDLEVGPDGALYFLDWHNPLIGHMQHHLRDPSRDKVHGRVYRVTHEARAPVKPVPIAGRTTSELVALLRSPWDRERYRARIELGLRPASEVQAALGALEPPRDAQAPALEHHRLEALWLQQRQGLVDKESRERLLDSVLASPEPRARAAAVRVLRHAREHVPDAEARLCALVRDPHPRVRLEALVALSFFPGARAAEAALDVLRFETDRFLDYALEETLQTLEPHWRAALVSGAPFAQDNPAGLARLLARLETEDLARVRPCEALHVERLSRFGLEPGEYAGALEALAVLRQSSPPDELVAAIRRADGPGGAPGGHEDHLISGLFASARELPPDEAKSLAAPFAELALSARRTSTRRLAAAARLLAEGSVESAWREACASPTALLDLLAALPLMDDAGLAAALYPRVLALLDGPPPGLAADFLGPAGTRGRYVRIELAGSKRTLTLAEVEVVAGGENIAPSGQASQSTTAWSGVAARALDGNTSGAFGDDGQTHTLEDRADPWWELDLGAERAIERIVVWNRGEENGRFARRLDGYLLRVLDAERKTVHEAGTPRADDRSDSFELGSPAARLRGAAARALASMDIRGDDTVRALVGRLGDAELRPALVEALLSLPAATWPEDAREDLGEQLPGLLAQLPQAHFSSAAGRDLLALVDALVPHLEKEQAGELRRVRRSLGPRVIVLRPIPDSLQYDRREFSVEAGRPVELTFHNVDIMPHNLVLTAPGALARVGLAAEAMAASPDAAARAYVPELAEVLHATGLLDPGASQTLRFTAPAQVGDHPYVCTFPGHWIRMNGVMHVVASADVEEPERALSAAAPVRKFVRHWKLAELERDAVRLEGRSPERGRTVLEAASCTTCHAVDGRGGTTGPELREVAARHGALELLQHIVEPSRAILEGYESELFITADERVVAGRVLREDAQSVHVLFDPYKSDVEILAKGEIRERRPVNVSLMPEGLLSTFERAEILDLLAYLRSLATAGGK